MRSGEARGAEAGLEGPLGGWDASRGARVELDRHAQRAREGLEHRLTLVVRVVAAQVVDVHGRVSVVDEALEELVREVDVELAHAGAAEVDVVFEARTAGEIDHCARKRLVERNVGVAVAADALLVAERLRHRHAERDADVLDGMVRVDLEVALRVEVEVEGAVARELVEHVVEEGDAGSQRRLACAVEVDGPASLRFLRVALDLCLAHVSGDRGGERVDQSRVLVGGSDGEPQAILEQGMRPMEVADQYTTLRQALERAARLRNARADEVRRRGA